MKLLRSILILTCSLAFATTLDCAPIPSNLPAVSPIPSSPPRISQSNQGLVEKLTIEQLAVKTDSILSGRVTDVVSHQEGQGNIYTLVTVSVEQTLKGETLGEVVIKVPGGEVDGFAMMVTDAPGFQPGERAVVFLEKGEGIFTVVGGFQGKFTIDNNNMVNSKPLTEFIDQIRDILAEK